MTNLIANGIVIGSIYAGSPYTDISVLDNRLMARSSATTGRMLNIQREVSKIIVRGNIFSHPGTYDSLWACINTWEVSLASIDSNMFDCPNGFATMRTFDGLTSSSLKWNMVLQQYENRPVVNGGTIDYASSIPTTGTWNVGDIVFNHAPTDAAGVPAGWICVTAGTLPSTGKFRVFGVTT